MPSCGDAFLYKQQDLFSSSLHVELTKYPSIYSVFVFVLVIVAAFEITVAADLSRRASVFSLLSVPLISLSACLCEFEPPLKS